MSTLTSKYLRNLLAAIALASAAVPVHATTLDIEVHGLVCAFCAQGIEKKLRKEAATEDVYVSLEQHRVLVALKDGQDLADERLRELLEDAGYKLVDIQRREEPLAVLREQTGKKP